MLQLIRALQMLPTRSDRNPLQRNKHHVTPLRWGSQGSPGTELGRRAAGLEGGGGELQCNGDGVSAEGDGKVLEMDGGDVPQQRDLVPQNRTLKNS